MSLRMAGIKISGLVYARASLCEFVHVCVLVWYTPAAGLKLKPYAEHGS